jgi:hypothetical protein
MLNYGMVLVVGQAARDWICRSPTVRVIPQHEFLRIGPDRHLPSAGGQLSAMPAIRNLPPRPLCATIVATEAHTHPPPVVCQKALTQTRLPSLGSRPRVRRGRSV